MSEEQAQNKRTASQRQRDQMFSHGFIHVGEECTPEDYRNWIDASYSGAGYSTNWGPAYEADGETEKSGLIQIYYN